MQIALGIAFLVGGLLVVNWIIHLLFRPVSPEDPGNDADHSTPTEGP